MCKYLDTKLQNQPININSVCFTLLKLRNLRIPAIVLFMKIFKQKTHNMHKVPLNRTLVHKNTLNSFIEHRLLQS